MELERVILASASPRRLELLRSLGLTVDVVASGYDEPALPELSPAALAATHAREKLAAAARAAYPWLVVAADTVVDVDGIALGKPHDRANAVRMLELLSGREHLVHTAFALGLPGSAEPVEEIETTRVRFHTLTGDEIADYVDSGEPMDKAGAYGIQGYAAALVARIDGDFYTVMGFPLGRFVRTLRRLGLAVPAAKVRA
ncbi:MAG TPA: Maf family protein [Verrucomicrobiae bacterium]|jgi:septum formation protein|nr:Maf family protein [Verrucomicrobiae bacterium]